MNEALELGRRTANTHANVGHGTYGLIRFHNKTDDAFVLVDASVAGRSKIDMQNGAGARILIDTAEAGTREIRLREVCVRVGDVDMHALVLMSAPY